MTKQEALEIMNKNACFWAEEGVKRNDEFVPFRTMDEFGSEECELMVALDVLHMSVRQGLIELNAMAEMHLETLAYNKCLANALRG